ncbi:calcium/sodium antiporter [Fulvivirga sp. 29W222]|uniref:Calcium/sodium antiporter n=1 Tax=Fulvivirga marina TaxID=2494733 RepID=A0A937KCZ8_9BACT|nr:calcium/sodium antiporter [Fulvivirga marina]MBL6448067.1 calcium/sodium antiporter [Fulvivirga marina]
MDDFILLLVGIFGLWGGTQITIKNAALIAEEFHVSELFIGLTILAFGTDLPELIVAIDGSIHNLHGEQTSRIIVGNAIGSSVCQISVVIGVVAIYSLLSIDKKQLQHLAIELLGSIVLLSLVAFDHIVTWNDGALLIIAFLIYFFTLWQGEKHAKASEIKAEIPPKPPAPKRGTIWARFPVQIILLVLGLAIVAFSSEFTIDHALAIAQIWSIQQSFIGAVIVGLGTSLPELAISINAIANNKSGLSIGNIVGSNIFDLLVPIGIASLISDIKVEGPVLWFDMPYLFVLTGTVIYFFTRERGLQHWEGIGLTVMYLVYAFVKFFL